jgi:hypothetical protein
MVVLVTKEPSFPLELVFWPDKAILMPQPILEPDLDLRSSGFLK